MLFLLCSPKETHYSLLLTVGLEAKVLEVRYPSTSGVLGPSADCLAVI